jgi:hypothetical protein
MEVLIMSLATVSCPRAVGAKVCCAVLLAASACVYLGYHAAIALEPDDSAWLETPLTLALARQIEEGPARLYGPYTGARPTVIIHAPFYYRLAALAAWPLAKLGFEPLIASFAAGRLLSVLAFVAAIGLAARLSMIDGTSWWAGLLSAILIAAAPVVAKVSITVRPDTLALCLQTLGVFLVVRTWMSGRSNTFALAAAYIAFGLAFCAKQHAMVASLASTVLLCGACARRQVPLRTLAIAMVCGALAVLIYYGAEWLVVGRSVARAAFEVPAALKHVAPGSWRHVTYIAKDVSKLSIGLIAVGFAAIWMARGKLALGRLDAVIGFYFVAELVAMVPLFLNSEGAWSNYAMQAVVFAAVLVGRGLERALSEVQSVRRLLPIALAAGVLFVADARLAWISASIRAADRADLKTIFADPRVGASTPSELYFVGAPQHNRRFGRADLAHDEWLYTAFEAMGVAEPREIWLKDALQKGSVRHVIAPVKCVEVPGLEQRLPELGYRPIRQSNHHLVWERRGDPSAGLGDLPLAAGPASTDRNGSQPTSPHFAPHDDRVTRTVATPPR